MPRLNGPRGLFQPNPLVIGSSARYEMSGLSIGTSSEYLLPAQHLPQNTCKPKNPRNKKRKRVKKDLGDFCVKKMLILFRNDRLSINCTKIPTVCLYL